MRASRRRCRAATTFPEYLYTGQRRVSGAALYDYGARFYDPQLVQFVSQDPVRQYVQAYARIAQSV